MLLLLSINKLAGLSSNPYISVITIPPDVPNVVSKEPDSVYLDR